MKKNRGRSSGSSSKNESNMNLANYSQTDANKDVDAILFFVIPEGCTVENCSQALISTLQLTEEYSYTSKLVNGSDILNIKPQKNNVFIFDPFSGPAFDYLSNLFFKLKSFMIVGPQCMRQGILGPDSNVIHSRGYPFFTLGMRNICISLTGFSKEATVELTDMVQKMNGVVSKAYNVATTHVVAATTLTAKCHEAYKNDVPVMAEGWIRAVWAESQTEFVNATSEKFIKYACPVFHNIQLCVSQVSSSMKAILEKTITQNGGIYSKDFQRYGTHILVTPYASGEKFRFALQWKIPCVTPEWVQKSRQANHILPLEPFFPPRGPAEQLCSTQLEGALLSRPDFNATNMTGISELHDGPKNDIVNCTAASIDSMSVTNNTIVRTNTTVSQRGVLPSEMEVLKKAEYGFLDGCTIYLCEFNSGDQIGEIRKFLNSSATRLNQITEKISHILIVNDKISDAEIKTIKSLDHSPHIVTLEWLLESAKCGKPANEELYIHEMFQKERKQSLHTSNILMFPESSKHQELNRSGNGKRSSQNSSGHSISDTIYQRNGNVTSQSRASGVFQEPAKSVPVEPVATGNDESFHGSKDGHTLTTVGDVLFEGLKFKVDLEDVSITEEFENLIKEHGGIPCEEGDDGVECFICPPVYEPHEMNVRLFHATKFWVSDTIAEQNLDEPDLYYHVPQIAKEGSKQLLRGVVIYISAYPNGEKEYISALATFMGAQFQDVFSKKDNPPKTLKTTHLICSSTDNDKYRAAVRWKTPAVTADWVLECYKRGELLSPSDFSLENKDRSDSTVSMYMRTPRTQKLIDNRPRSTIQPKFKRTLTSDCASSYLGAGLTNKPTESNKNSIAAKLDFDGSDLETPPPKVPVSNFKTPALALLQPNPAEESPLFREGMSREGSRQIKRALQLVCEESPQVAKRRKSTPIKQIHLSVAEILQNKYANLKVQCVKSTNNITESLTASQKLGVVGRNIDEELEQEDDEHDEDDGISLSTNLNPDISKNDDEDDEIDRVLQMYDKQGKEHGKLSKQSPHDVNSNSMTSNSTGYGSNAGSRKTSATSVGNPNVSKPTTRSPPKVPSHEVQEKLGSLNDFEVEGKDGALNPVISWVVENNQNDDDDIQIVEVKEDDGCDSNRNSNGDQRKPPELVEAVETRTRGTVPEKKSKPASRATTPELPVETSERITRRGRSKKVSSASSVSSVKSSYSTRRGRTTNSRADTQPLSFILSGCTASEKVDTKEVIERLGGSVSEMDFYDRSANAVIASKITRSEKILGAIAGGMPILRPEYIAACNEAGKLLQLESFMWDEEHGTTESERNMARVARHWYKKIKQNPRCMPFSKFQTFLVEQKDSKREAYKRLIEAGGGKVVTEEDDEEVNIVIGDGDEAHAASNRLNAPIKIPMFLNDVILTFDECTFLDR